jgi:hypothetical protein
MSPIGTDDFWEDLLDFVEQGKVIPVISEHAASFGEGNEPLYPFLARELDSAPIFLFGLKASPREGN